ncbi:MAG: hypothetical protein Q4G26_14780, partial [Paracoccus sp. (in: a-proteobacteria)]|nr:hypothetical protein [Paracoccus sp. (in: a-proteobacteria)]
TEIPVAEIVDDQTSADPQIPTFREQLMDAIGANSSGIINGRPTSLGGRADMAVVSKWADDLKLSKATIITVINETMAHKRDGPPSTFRYFTPAMQREAARMAQPTLMPANSNEGHHDRPTASNRREAAAADRLGRIIDAAARNRSPSD